MPRKTQKLYPKPWALTRPTPFITSICIRKTRKVSYENDGEFWYSNFFFFPLTEAAHTEFSCTDFPIFESERPLIYSLEDIEFATSNFDETKKIGEGGYGSVYFGVLGEQVHSLFPLSPLLSRHSEDSFFQTIFTNVSVWQ